MASYLEEALRISALRGRVIPSPQGPHEHGHGLLIGHVIPWTEVSVVIAHRDFQEGNLVDVSVGPVDLRHVGEILRHQIYGGIGVLVQGPLQHPAHDDGHFGAGYGFVRVEVSQIVSDHNADVAHIGYRAGVPGVPAHIPKGQGGGVYRQQRRQKDRNGKGLHILFHAVTLPVNM